VLFTARAQLAADARSARPAWEGLVARLVREVPAVPVEPVPVGLELAVDVGRAYGGFQPPPRQLMRPVRRGQRDRWVYSGVSWSDLDYPSDDLLPDVQDLLLQFRAAAGSAARYASPRSAWLTLGEVSTAFWSLLDQAARVGLVLVTEKAGPPVVMSERVGIHLDLRSAPDGGLAGVVALPREVWAPAELFEATESADPTFGSSPTSCRPCGGRCPSWRPTRPSSCPALRCHRWRSRSDSDPSTGFGWTGPCVTTMAASGDSSASTNRR